MIISRRHFLQSSILGTMSLGLSRGLLAQVRPARKLILVTCNGGWDVTFHLDPKPDGLSLVDVPAGRIRSAGGLTYFDADSCLGVVNSFMNAHRDVSAIVRGISVRSIAHDDCIRRMLTGTRTP